MHKIKEMLHKDDETTTSSSSSSHHEKHGGITHPHGGSSEHSHEHTKTKTSGLGGHEHLSTREFETGHVHHGEIEHGLGHQHTHSHEKIKTEKIHSHEHGEKHIMHDRELLKEGDLYKAGFDPAMNREVLSTSRTDDGVVRHRVDEGKVVKETIKEVELHKVQPVIHREREQKEIRHVVEPHKKFEVKDTKIHHHERDIDLGVRREASTLETSRSLGHAPHIESSREFLGKERQHQELPVKVEEHVHRKVEEHVHPVIYKEVLKPKVTEETHHIYEKVKEAPIETYEVKELGQTRGMGEGLREAEREFFARESSRGIILDEGHSCSRDIESHHHAHGLEHGHTHTHGLEHGHTHTHQKEGLLQKAEHKIKDKSLKKDKSYKKDKSHKEHKHLHGSSGTTTYRDESFVTRNVAAEPIIGHHQNIGAHHVPAGAVPAGHNTAYDAALCNQCTDNSICSHGVRDAAMMKKMNEKKMLKDEKLADKEAKKTHNVV